MIFQMLSYRDYFERMNNEIMLITFVLLLILTHLTPIPYR